MSDKSELDIWGSREAIGQKNWVMQAVQARPGSTLKAVADAAQIDRDTANTILLRLIDLQAIKAVNSGQDSYFYPTSPPSYPIGSTPGGCHIQQ